MRRSPLDDFDVRVSVEKLESPSLWGNLQSTMSTAAGRWPAAELSEYLRRRATVHVSVLALATAILAGSAFAGRAPDSGADFATASAGTDSLEVAAKTAIIAHAIPFTSPSGDSSYLVQPGDTLTSISRQTGVNEEALLAFNGYTSSDALNVGLRLRIPDLSTVPAEQLRIKDTAPHDSTPLVSESSAGEAPPPQKPSPELTIHEVQRGDTASKLAAAAGVTEATVLASNNLSKTTVLSLGQTLVIPAISGRLVATKPGDTVDGLAGKYGSTGAGIIAANKLDARTQDIAPAIRDQNRRSRRRRRWRLRLRSRRRLRRNLPALPDSPGRPRARSPPTSRPGTTASTSPIRAGHPCARHRPGAWSTRAGTTPGSATW